MPQLKSLLAATISGFAEIESYEIDLVRDGLKPRRLVLNAHKLVYDDDDNVRIMLAVVDVTDARLAEKLKDELLSEKAILLQELQHRVANSLQIVASVLMQSARRVQSDEARGHLKDAHSHVMSITTLKRQLVASRLGDVELRPYFSALCESIAASMTHDRSRISLDVMTDECKTTADISVSFGLIITELVINALKHAFPGRTQQGAIKVAYEADGDAWTLSVSDDGSAFRRHPRPRQPVWGRASLRHSRGNSAPVSKSLATSRGRWCQSSTHRRLCSSSHKVVLHSVRPGQSPCRRSSPQRGCPGHNRGWI